VDLSICIMLVSDWICLSMWLLTNFCDNAIECFIDSVTFDAAVDQRSWRPVFCPLTGDTCQVWMILCNIIIISCRWAESVVGKNYTVIALTFDLELWPHSTHNSRTTNSTSKSVQKYIFWKMSSVTLSFEPWYFVLVLCFLQNLISLWPTAK